MQIVLHRINTVDQLRTVGPGYGIEFDVRDYGQRLVVQHDPAKEGEDLERFLSVCRRRFLIVNLKSQGIVGRVKALLKKKRLNNYFFLDCALPEMLPWLKKAGSLFCARLSYYEKIDSVLALSGRVQWVWVDTYRFWPLTTQDYLKLKKNRFRICLASPELHGKPQNIPSYQRYFRKSDMTWDAVCTKRPYVPLWEAR